MLALVAAGWLLPDRGGSPGPAAVVRAPAAAPAAATAEREVPSSAAPPADDGAVAGIAAPARRPAAASDPASEDPAPVVDRPPTEREVRAALLALARVEGLDALEQEAERLLFGDSRAAARAAAVMAVFEAEAPGAARLAARAIAELPDASTADAVSVPVLAVQQLQAHAERNPACREVLMTLVDGRLPTDDGALRRGAASTLARVGDHIELARLAALLRSEPDPSLPVHVATGLRDNPLGGEVAQAFDGLLPELADDVDATEVGPR